MTTEIRKAALDAILTRIHLEGYRNYGSFAKEAALWFAEIGRREISEKAFISEFRTGTDFHKFNEIRDPEQFLRTVYSDVVEAIDAVPSARPSKLYVGEIDSFSQVSQIGAEEIDVNLLQQVSESQVKRYLREIIGEPYDQTDWGGELNDLFTNRVTVDGRRVDAAFMLKGPGIDGPMRIKDAGTRGDQFQRLFQSPAEMYVIQFNGKIEDRTIRHIKDLAKAYEAPMYCIIDGTDTARLLKAYDKI